MQTLPAMYIHKT